MVKGGRAELWRLGPVDSLTPKLSAGAKRNARPHFGNTHVTPQTVASQGQSAYHYTKQTEKASTLGRGPARRCKVLCCHPGKPGLLQASHWICFGSSLTPEIESLTSQRENIQDWGSPKIVVFVLGTRKKHTQIETAIFQRRKVKPKASKRPPKHGLFVFSQPIVLTVWKTGICFRSDLVIRSGLTGFTPYLLDTFGLKGMFAGETGPLDRWTWPKGNSARRPAGSGSLKSGPERRPRVGPFTRPVSKSGIHVVA